MKKILFLFAFISFVPFLTISCACKKKNEEKTKVAVEKIETFTFSSNTTTLKGKIFLPKSYETNKNLPAIYLIDYTEQHFKIATDEFEKVIDGVRKIEGFDALVISLENIPNIDATPETFQNQYEVFENLSFYVDNKYTNNSSKTFIGRGSEASIVLMSLFLENSVFENFIATDPSPKFITAFENILKKNDLATLEQNRKLHFSFSPANGCRKCSELNMMISKLKYPWLQTEVIEYTDSNYENTYPISFAAGIKYIFEK